MDTEKTAQPFDPASFEHVPVLLNECLDGLKIDPAGTYLDGTAGGAGHSRQIALRLNGEQGGRLISLDQDPDAVQTARARLAGLPATVVQINFRYAGQALEQLGIETINGALLDLGVSSHQLDDAARGFSYRADAPLDMRMSQEGETAADLVNSESREELARILRDYGEEPFAWQIAGRIVEARETAPIETTLQLADIVASAMPPAERRKNKNPSRRTFQALRIAVNHELDALEEGLDTIFADVYKRQVHAIGNAGTLGQCDQQPFPQQRGGNAQIDIAHTRQGDPGCKAAFGSQQHQHHGTGRGFQPKADVPPQAQHRTAADAGQILQQAHAAKEQSSQQRCEQPDREQALGPQQLRLGHTGGCPAHAHSSQHPHHQAEPTHGGGLRRALRLGIRRFLLG